MDGQRISKRNHVIRLEHIRNELGLGDDRKDCTTCKALIAACILTLDESALGQELSYNLRMILENPRRDELIQKIFGGGK